VRGLSGSDTPRPVAAQVTDNRPARATVELQAERLALLSSATSANEILGVEGVAAREYFAALPHLPTSRKEWNTVGRVKRPPTDPVNCLLSSMDGTPSMEHSNKSASTLHRLPPWHPPGQTSPGRYRRTARARNSSGYFLCAATDDSLQLYQSMIESLRATGGSSPERHRGNRPPALCGAGEPPSTGGVIAASRIHSSTGGHPSCTPSQRPSRSAPTSSSCSRRSTTHLCVGPAGRHSAWSTVRCAANSVR
jgi:hypothetical protein